MHQVQRHQRYDRDSNILLVALPTIRRKFLPFVVVVLSVVVFLISFEFYDNNRVDAAVEEIVDVNVDGMEGSIDDNDKVITDDPWEIMTKFIRTNILFDDSNNNDDNEDLHRHSTRTTGDRSHNGNPSNEENNVWDSFRFSRTSINKDVVTDEDQEQQQQDPPLHEKIQEGWNHFVQNLSAIPNPFRFQPLTGDTENEDAKTNPSLKHPINATVDRRSRHNNLQYDALTDLIESVSSIGHHQKSDKNQLSIPDMIDLFWKTLQNVQQQLEGTFKSVLDLILPIVHPLQLYYFMLGQEIVHNPVYKRRQHAYMDEVSVDIAVQISEGLYVAQLAYAKDCKTIEKYLQNFQNNSWILINCTTTTRPFQPAHFLAIRRPIGKRNDADNNNDSWTYHRDTTGDDDATSSTSWTSMLWENLRDALNLTDVTTKSNRKLEVMLVICGTKDFADMMSDAMLEPTPYGNSTQQGLAHNGIYQSALYIHSTYREFLENLIQKTNRTKLKLWLIGHSLGGGTAALACLEFNKPYHINDTNKLSNHTISLMDAYALGFGTPAVLSREHSENARSKVTTIIHDADAVPRMSGATLVNFLLNITSYNDWITEAQMDVRHLHEILKDKSPFPDIWVDTLMSKVYDWITSSDQVNDTMKASLLEKIVTPVLIPPGDCIHVYRDGTSWSGVYYPCHHFNTLEGVRYMVDDHLIPIGYYRGLLGYIRGLKNDMNWQFQPDLSEIPVSS